MHVMDQIKKCSSITRSDCTLETIISSNINSKYSQSCPSSPAAKKSKHCASFTTHVISKSNETIDDVSTISFGLRKILAAIRCNLRNGKTNGIGTDSISSTNGEESCSVDNFSVANKLHDVQKNASQDHLLKNGECTTSSQHFPFIIEPQSIFYVFWLCLVNVAYLYNCWVIPLRTSFPYQTKENAPTWMIVDYLMDLLYFIDIVVVKPRVMYLENGFWVRVPKLTRRNYFQKIQFKMDMLSLTPLDLFYFICGSVHPMLRLPRLLKLQTFWEFFNHFDNVLSSPYVVRVTRTLAYMLYLVHLNTCAYYEVSIREGLGSNKWVYDGKGNAYIRCFYRAIKTATSIGKNPAPSNEMEYLFMTCSWLMGVFVFATLIGQIRDIVATASKSQTEYRKLMDETLDYLRALNVPPQIRKRVEQWFSFTWEQQHTLDESRILDTLPQKLKTDVAINVHIKTLNKVQLFHDCDEALLRDLVLKLRPVLYLPGDFICRKGEVGKEMYIVKTGQVQVVSHKGPEEIVLATLTEGTVFGEISLLNLAGTNRRTADVRSHGFSSLFVLSKSDLNEAIRYYPNAQKILKKKARQLIKQNATREGREMPLEIVHDSNASSVSIHNDSFKLRILTRQPYNEILSADRYTCRMYRNKYSLVKKYSDAQVKYFLRQRKRRTRMKTKVAQKSPENQREVRREYRY